MVALCRIGRRNFAKRADQVLGATMGDIFFELLRCHRSRGQRHSDKKMNVNLFELFRL